MTLGLLGRHADDRTEPVVVLLPVHQRDVAGELTRLVLPNAEYPPITPPVFAGSATRRGIVGKDRIDFWLEGARLDILPRQQRPGPEVRLVGPPEVVVVRPVDRVIAVRQIVDREAPGNRLLIQRL